MNRTIEAMTDHSDLVGRLRSRVISAFLPESVHDTDCYVAADLIEQLASTIAELTADRDQLRVRCDNLSDDAEMELMAVYQEVERLRKVLIGASHALRSYEHGNGSPYLARTHADAIDAAIAQQKHLVQEDGA